MDLIQRLEWLALGAVIGFVLGYFSRALRDIKEELDEVRDNVRPPRDEKGIMSHRVTSNIALAVVVLLTLYAAILSQHASNKATATQEDQKQNLDCTTQVLFDAIEALNERTTYSTTQADANIDLVRAQLEWLTRIGQEPPLTEAEQVAQYTAYVSSAQEFLELTEKTKNQQIQNPFPTVDDLTSCLAQTNKETKEPKQ